MKNLFRVQTRRSEAYSKFAGKALKRTMWLMIICLPLLSMSQTDTTTGIHWTTGLSWEQVKQKAKAENKYIFIDAYATWCLPCKQMDKEVYSKEKIGRFVNDKFISVKVQMDSSKYDNEDVKNWYALAKSMKSEFNVIGFPTYLFFSPRSTILHKAMGAKNENDFLTMMADALNPPKQYYTLLDKFEKGKLSIPEMKTLITIAKELQQDSMANLLSQKYINEYLFTLDHHHLFTEENIRFVALNLNNSGSRAFLFFFANIDNIDSVMNEKEYAHGFLDNIIFREEIKPLVIKNIEDGTSPRWNMISKAISRKYSAQHAVRNILRSKVWYYKKTKKWSKYAGALVKQINTLGIGIINPKNMIPYFLNNYAFEVFQYSNNKVEIKTALKWAQVAIEADSSSPIIMDTKANLLYKLGRKKEAIELERKAMKLAPHDPTYSKTLEKMLKGKPTWLINNENAK